MDSMLITSNEAILFKSRNKIFALSGKLIENNGKCDINCIVFTIPQSKFRDDDIIMFKAKFV